MTRLDSMGLCPDHTRTCGCRQEVVLAGRAQDLGGPSGDSSYEKGREIVTENSFVLRAFPASGDALQWAEGGPAASPPPGVSMPPVSRRCSAPGLRRHRAAGVLRMENAALSGQVALVSRPVDPSSYSIALSRQAILHSPPTHSLGLMYSDRAPSETNLPGTPSTHDLSISQRMPSRSHMS